MNLKNWWAETHGAFFELVRHFLMRFFDSDMVTESGQWTKVLVWAFALLTPAFFLMAQVLNTKYRHFSKLAGPEPYRHAVRADELWLIALGMGVVGLLTAIQWQSLFPSELDYLNLGALPLRPRNVFLAKFAALILLIAAVIVSLNALPSILFPLVSMGRWATGNSLLKHIAAHAATCALAGFFLFFSILAIQGLLLAVFRAAWFARITNYLQGFGITLMLASIVLSFSISPAIERILLRPEMAAWLPPVWFLGLYQIMLGDSDPYFRWLGNLALIGSAAAVALSLVSYLISYGRHRKLAMEGIAAGGKRSALPGWLLDRFAPNPRQQAILVFIARTLARSSQHRGVLMAYFGFALPIVLTAAVEMPALMKAERVTLASFAYFHMVLLLFLLTGLRHVFGIPVELRANWTFRITEREGRAEWLRAVDGATIVPAILAIVMAPLALEAALLGWRGVQEALLFIPIYLLLYEALFYDWQKLPFTCSYVPGRENGFVTVVRAFGVLGVLPVFNVFLVNCVYSPALYTALVAASLVAWVIVRHSRRSAWSYTPMRFEEEADPAVRSLNLKTPEPERQKSKRSAPCKMRAPD